MRSIPIDAVDVVLPDPGRVIEPVLTTWTRLEPLPLTTDLQPGLAAGIADPLWLLCRQWQFLEFAGEDAGTPIEVRVEGESAPLARLRLGAEAADADYDNAALPLEVAVEREPVWALHPRLAAEAGLHLRRLLADVKPPGQHDAF